MIDIHINKTDKTRTIYLRHFSGVDSKDIIIGNSLGGYCTLSKFMEQFNKDKLIKILEDTKECYVEEGMYENELTALINKLKNYKVYNRVTVMTILIEYYKIVNDNEDYIYINDNDEMTRLYVWFKKIED